MQLHACARAIARWLAQGGLDHTGAADCGRDADATLTAFAPAAQPFCWLLLRLLLDQQACLPLDTCNLHFRVLLSVRPCSQWLVLVH